VPKPGLGSKDRVPDWKRSIEQHRHALAIERRSRCRPHGMDIKMRLACVVGTAHAAGARSGGHERVGVPLAQRRSMRSPRPTTCSYSGAAAPDLEAESIVGIRPSSALYRVCLTRAPLPKRSTRISHAGLVFQCERTCAPLSECSSDSVIATQDCCEGGHNRKDWACGRGSEAE
jgi:hypothetical protein